jgi:hypothetical protein
MADTEQASQCRTTVYCCLPVHGQMCQRLVFSSLTTDNFKVSLIHNHSDNRRNTDEVLHKSVSNASTKQLTSVRDFSDQSIVILTFSDIAASNTAHILRKMVRGRPGRNFKDVLEEFHWSPFSGPGQRLLIEAKEFVRNFRQAHPDQIKGDFKKLSYEFLVQHGDRFFQKGVTRLSWPEDPKQIARRIAEIMKRQNW